MAGSAFMTDDQGVFSNAVKKSRYTTPRYFTALFLTVVYLIITMSPLAPVALLRGSLAHSMTVESAGNGDVCRCSPERRAGHTCCCQQKSYQKADQVAACCNKKGSGKGMVISCSCGTGKVFALLNLSKSEILPFVFDAEAGCQLSATEHNDHHRRMPSRPDDPPVPPPHIYSTS